MKEAAGAHAQLDLSGELRLGVDERDRRAMIVGLNACDFEANARAGSVPVSLDAGRAEPAAGGGGDEAEARRLVETAGHPLGARRDGERRE